MPFENGLFPERVVARVPREFPRLVTQAAAQQFVTPATFVRQAVGEKLTRDGFVVDKSAAGPSGSDRKAA